MQTPLEVQKYLQCLYYHASNTAYKQQLTSNYPTGGNQETRTVNYNMARQLILY